MKKIIYTLFALLFVFQLKAQDSLLIKGNQYYSDQKYDEAVTAYKDLLAKGIESAELYFNMGNALYKKGDIPQAILNYERAKLLAPNDADIQFNLDLANQHVVDAIDVLPQVFFVRWWNQLIKSKPVDTWGKVSLISFFIFLIFLAFYVFSSNGTLRRLGFWFGILFLAGAILTYVFAHKQKNRLEAHNYAIITQPSVTVKSSPSDTGTNIFLIHEGLKVEIVDQLGNWYEIRLADGNEGWLLAEAIERI